MDSFDFDKSFNRTRKMIVVAWIVQAVIGLSLMGGLIWVAWHFISKFW